MLRISPPSQVSTASAARGHAIPASAATESGALPSTAPKDFSWKRFEVKPPLARRIHPPASFSGVGFSANRSRRAFEDLSWPLFGNVEGLSGFLDHYQTTLANPAPQSAQLEKMRERHRLLLAREEADAEKAFLARLLVWVEAQGIQDGMLGRGFRLPSWQGPKSTEFQGARRDALHFLAFLQLRLVHVHPAKNKDKDAVKMFAQGLREFWTGSAQKSEAEIIGKVEKCWYSYLFDTKLEVEDPKRVAETVAESFRYETKLWRLAEFPESVRKIKLHLTRTLAHLYGRAWLVGSLESAFRDPESREVAARLDHLVPTITNVALKECDELYYETVLLAFPHFLAEIEKAKRILQGKLPAKGPYADLRTRDPRLVLDSLPVLEKYHRTILYRAVMDRSFLYIPRAVVSISESLRELERILKALRDPKAAESIDGDAFLNRVPDGSRGSFADFLERKCALFFRPSLNTGSLSRLVPGFVSDAVREFLDVA